MKFLKNLFGSDDSVDLTPDAIADSYYAVTEEQMAEESCGKMILVEPRAFSESQQIADHIRNRNTVVVNLKRVTADQAKRIIDFLGGTIYAVNGSIQKVGGGIFLCTPNNINIQGKITDELEGKDIHDNKDLDIEW